MNQVAVVVAAVSSLLTLVQTFPHPLDERLDSEVCGYDSCPVPKPGMLNVHLVPHSHDDVGWLKTVDQYYYGSRTNIQNAGVQYILDSVVDALFHDPKKKFIYVETAFFWKWWTEQEDHMKHKVKKIVKNGQLEFIGGAWSMNDEATTHYQSIIDQFTWGFRKLNDTFGTCGRPKIGWQIDPFGHSREMASLMAHFGFDGLFFGRLDYEDKDNRLLSNTMEMIWEGDSVLGNHGDLFTGALYNRYSAPRGFCFDVLCQDEPFVTNLKSYDYNVQKKVDEFLNYVLEQSAHFQTKNIILTMGDDFNYQDAHMYYKNLDELIRYSSGSKSDIFTGVLYNLYQAPRGFCFDIMCGDEPIIDDVHSPDYNVPKRVNKFLDFIEWQNLNYRNNEIMVTMGGDFNYLDAHYYFKNLEKLIRYVNKLQETGSKVNVFYSTPSCYAKSLNDANITWPTKQDDFFPYSSDPHAFWTGYFTSRPTLKYFERQGNNYLQICKQLSSLALLGPEDNPNIDVMREAMGIMQHHDAITGTEKQHVANDYARILTDAFRKCGMVVSAGLNKLMNKKGDSSLPPLAFNSCLLTNISECDISAYSPKFVATVYNPLSRPVNFFVRLPVGSASFTVEDPKGNDIIYQIVPVPTALLNIPGRSSQTFYELVFKAENVPPLGYRSYYVVANPEQGLYVKEDISDFEEFSIGDDAMTLTLSGETKLLSSMRANGKKLDVVQTLEYYQGEVGNNHAFENRSSGAYIFRPKTERSISIADNATATVYKGPLVHEVHQEFTPWASQVIRQYIGESHAEIEWLVGPIPIIDGFGKEIISKYSTPLDSQGLFYTDSNGRQTIERKRNFRPTWQVNLHEKVSGNYYPVTTDIAINDKETELAVIIDRAEGGSSLKDGDVELMLHRRLLHDDAFGVDEALNEEAYGVGLVARGKHWLLLGNVSDPHYKKQKRLLVQEKVLSPHVVLTDITFGDFNEWKKNYRLEFSGLTEALPSTVQILTLEPWKKSSYLLRLEHLTELNEYVNVDLSKLFSSFDITSAKETSLGADRWLDEVSRLKWRKETNEVFEDDSFTKTAEDDFPVIRLSPKQIRTFIIEILPKAVI